MAVPVFFSVGGRCTVREGRVTLVTSRVFPTPGNLELWMRVFS